MNTSESYFSLLTMGSRSGIQTSFPL